MTMTSPARSNCQFGTACEAITPPAPSRLACTGDFDSFSTAVHDEQFVRALAVRGPDGSLTLWVSFELLFVDASLHQALADHAAAVHGVGPGAVTVAAVHNHNAAAAAGYNPGRASSGYDELLLSKGIAAIDRAVAHSRPGYLEQRRTHIDLNIQRRQVVDGQAVAGPNDGAPRDTELVVLTITDPEGRLGACLIVWACHPVFYPERTVLTGEFPSRLVQLLAVDRYGCAPMFFQGAAGDARPRASVVDGAFAPRPFEVIDSFARDLADQVLAVLEQPGSPVSLAPQGSRFVIDLPLTPLDREDFAQVVAEGGPSAGHPLGTHATLRVTDYDQRPSELSLACTLTKLGSTGERSDSPLWLATMGGEPCHDIKQLVVAAVGEPVIFIGYTDATGYIVSDRMIPEGGYEVTSAPSFGHLGPLAPGVDARISAGFAEAADRIRQL